MSRQRTLHETFLPSWPGPFPGRFFGAGKWRHPSSGRVQNNFVLTGRPSITGRSQGVGDGNNPLHRDQPVTSGDGPRSDCRERARAAGDLCTAIGRAIRWMRKSWLVSAARSQDTQADRAPDSSLTSPSTSPTRKSKYRIPPRPATCSPRANALAETKNKRPERGNTSGRIERIYNS